MNSATWRQILLAFLIGAVAGSLVASKCPLSDREFRPKDGSRMFERFSRELKLTPDQKVKVSAVLEAQREKFKAIREESRPRMEEMRQNGKREIEALLTPEQIEKFHKIQARREKFRETRHGRRGLGSR